MNATTKSLLRVGNSKFSLNPEFPSCGCVSESCGRVSESCGRVSESCGRVSEKTCRMQWTQPKTKICSVGKVVEMNKIIIFCNVQ